MLTTKIEDIFNVFTTILILKKQFPLYTYTVALFCSAALMFYIQPLVGKWLLPAWGGTPQIWNTCMSFFQTILFAGYCYVHYSEKLLTIKQQVIIHIALTIIALLIFPINLSSSNISVNQDNPQWGIIVTLFISVGMPMFIISSTAPLLQRWFSYLNHVQAADPYFLYVASNAGSLFALVTYPIIIEPFFGISQQTILIKLFFIGLVIMLGICAFIFFKDCNIFIETNIKNEASQKNISWQQRLRWFVLALLPSSLLLSVTTYITTDIASAPLFWIIPLMIYLLTFILAFSRKTNFSLDRLLLLHAFLMILMIILLAGPMTNTSWGTIGIVLGTFFLTAFICHYQLAQLRPAVAHLTEFYLWLSLGGVIGGAFNTLFAPILFNQLWEFPIALTLACLLRPSSCKVNTLNERRKDIVIPIALLGSVSLVLFISKESSVSTLIGFLLMSMAGLVIWKFKENTIRFSLSVGLILLVVPALRDNISDRNKTLGVVRDFFGIYCIYEDKNVGLRILKHGTTVHGAQKITNHQLLTEPVSYYYREGPFGTIFTNLKNQLGSKPVGLIGLGVGGLSCYGNEGSNWTFYEIDPLVERIARDERYFSYLKNCPPAINVIIGDARLKLKDAPSQYYEMIILDAFSSDSIPTHLLTKEALTLYMEKLSSTGVLVLHLSNRHLDLESVVSNLAKYLSLTGRIKYQKPRKEKYKSFEASVALVAILAKNEKNLGAVAQDKNWDHLAETTNRIWTDDYIDLLSVLGNTERIPRFD